MDQRRSKRIVLLFSLVLLSGVLLFFWNHSQMQEALAEDLNNTIGVLSQDDALTEAQLIKAFNGDMEAQAISDGEGLKQKYGFLEKGTREQRILKRYYRQGLLSLCAVFLGMAGIFFLLFRKNVQAQLDNQKMEDRFQEEKNRNELLLERTRQEESNVKSSLTDIVHQLKTPIASLKLSMEIALSEDYTAEERQEFKEQCETQISKLDMMLDGLAKISQLEKNLIQLRPERYAIRQLMNEIISSVILKALDKEIEIELELEEVFFVNVDYKWTVEAVTNVVENAVKYSPKQTTVRLRITPMVTFALVEVIDQGSGIAKDELSRIYQRFYRGTQAEIQEVEGSGVGLYLTRKIIEEQGGAVMAKPAQPAGANFQITLPLG